MAKIQYIFSISVITTFVKLYAEEKVQKPDKHSKSVNVTISNEKDTVAKVEEKCENGISILEALSATGLRSIRYAKEIPGVKEIVANDISHKAVEDIKRNISENNVADIVLSSHSDAT